MLLDTLKHFVGEVCEIRKTNGDRVIDKITGVKSQEVRIRMDDVGWIEDLPAMVYYGEKICGSVEVADIASIRNVNR